MIRFDAAACGDPQFAVTREWLETNGLGGYASSTIIGLNTRRYHGLLVAATNPPLGRYVLLAKLEETLVVDGHRYELSTNQYPGVIHPQGFVHQQEFRLDPFPVFTYAVAGLQIEKSVCMVQNESTAVIRYAVRTRTGEPLAPCSLEICPLIAFRDFHSLTHQDPALNPHVDQQPGRVSIHPYADLPALHLAHTADAIEHPGHWYQNFVYEAETARGLDDREDLYSPFALVFALSSGKPNAAIIASTEIHDVVSADSLAQSEIQRRAAIAESSVSSHTLVRQLTSAADQFIVDRGPFKSVIAGYHWFGDWSRDTMIALPGLTLVTGRYDDARGILLAFARSVDQGMLPNRFPDNNGPPEYNNVDGTLWLFEAVRAFLHYTAEYDFIQRNITPVLADIIDWHIRGTRFGIRVDTDGLLHAGEPGFALTWMDARAGAWAFTPRSGKPVEIQALWFNALCVMQQLAEHCEDNNRAERCASLAWQAQTSFNAKFWNAAEGCLYDVVDGEGRDASIRPNQIFAVSLPHTMLSPERAAGVVAVVRRELLTPLGLRTLSPQDKQYRPHYEGNSFARDSTYHQGAVWSWLMGPFITAFLKVNGRTGEALEQAAAWLEPFASHLADAGLGHISELFDAEAPHHPRGCIAQAWSAAELLRATVEDVFR